MACEHSLTTAVLSSDRFRSSVRYNSRMATSPSFSIRRTDDALRARARRVVPGGMYGHLDARAIADGFPQFFARGQGARIWDVDGNEYVDLMCSWGPIVLGHRDARVEAAVQAQLAQG